MANTKNAIINLRNIINNYYSNIECEEVDLEHSMIKGKAKFNVDPADDIEFNIIYKGQEFTTITVSKEKGNRINISLIMEKLIAIVTKNGVLGYPIAILENNEVLTCFYSNSNFDKYFRLIKDVAIQQKFNIRLLKDCANCKYSSYVLSDTKGEQLVCTKYFDEFDTEEEKLCHEHIFANGYPNKEDIRNICKLLIK